MQKRKKSVTNDIAQGEFRSVVERKINQLLTSKLEGTFKTVISPQGFHWGINFGAMKYYNKKSLQDVDTMLVFDNEGYAKFGNELLSTLYQKILENVSFQYSKADQSILEKLKTEAMLNSQALVSAYQNEVGEIQNPQNPLIEIIGFVNAHKNDEGFQDIYPMLFAQYQIFRSRNTKYIDMTSRELNALNYIKQLIGNMKNPSKENAGVQIDASKYSVGYRMPDVNQIYHELMTETNKMMINLEFTKFSGNQSSLSIDHNTAFVIPAPIFFFINSDTRYSLNTLTTESSTVSINMEYLGVTTLDASPTLASADGTTGWYDENLLYEIKNKTGRDETGYYLQNGEFDIDKLFGQDKRVNRMKEFVISQPPTVTMTITNANTSIVSECFQHSSSLDIDFFGLGFSSSTHAYTVSNCTIDTSSNTAKITLSAPEPSIETDLENRIAYVLGGVIAYPPEIQNRVLNLYKDLIIHRVNGENYSFSSNYLTVGKLTAAPPNFISNARNTGGDKFIDAAGNEVHKSWVSLWEDLCNDGNPASCAVCGSNSYIDGAHVLYNQNSRTLTHGDIVCIVPLCRTCNHPTNTQRMTLHQDTNAIYMTW